MSIYQIGDDQKISQLPLIWGSYKKSYVFWGNYIFLSKNRAFFIESHIMC